MLVKQTAALCRGLEDRISLKVVARRASGLDGIKGANRTLTFDFFLSFASTACYVYSSLTLVTRPFVIHNTCSQRPLLHLPRPRPLHRLPILPPRHPSRQRRNHPPPRKPPPAQRCRPLLYRKIPGPHPAIRRNLSSHIRVPYSLVVNVQRPRVARDNLDKQPKGCGARASGPVQVR